MAYTLLCGDARMRARSVYLAAAVWCSCGPVEVQHPASKTATQHDAIIGGTVDAADPEVFELNIIDTGNPSMGATCTATLIGSRTLLTAAHCVDPRTIMATGIDIYALNATHDNTVSFQQMIHVGKMQYHPAWDPNTLANDIGLCLLDKSPGIPPKPWNTATIDNLGGAPLRAVGYGATVGGANPSGAGTKKTVDLTFVQIAGEQFELGNKTSEGICHGDSGGPSFHTFPDGVERVVGVHSFTINANCLDGADSRTDYFKPFIETWLMQNETPTCDNDGLCKPGCTPVDQDCACAADGACTADCINLASDPDCPKDCVANGKCSDKPCPVPDVDCVATGVACGSGNNCESRVCLPDAQHPNPYCTISCQTDADCTAVVAGMECDLGNHYCVYTQVADTLPPGAPCDAASACASGTVCTGATLDKAYCSTPCMTQADCTDGTSTCTASFDGLTQFCQEPPRQVVTIPSIVDKQESDTMAQPGGCSAGLGVLPLMGVLGLLKRRRSRRS
jgi:hypothetical protein